MAAVVVEPVVAAPAIAVRGVAGVVVDAVAGASVGIVVIDAVVVDAGGDATFSLRLFRIERKTLLIGS